MPVPSKRRARATVRRFFRIPAVDTGVMILVLVSTLLLFLEYIGVIAETEAVRTAGDLISGVFIVELSLRWFAAPSAKAHWREHWLDWVAVIPFFRPLRALRVLRSARGRHVLGLERVGFIADGNADTAGPRRLEDSLRESLARYDGPGAEHAVLAPDLLHALTRLLDDERVDPESRGLICRGVAYFIRQDDLHPEGSHGDRGYLNQVYASLWVLRRLRTSLPIHVLEDAWEGEGSVVEFLAAELPDIEGLLGPEGCNQVQRYLGLSAVGERSWRG